MTALQIFAFALEALFGLCLLISIFAFIDEMLKGHRGR